jgi:hypothetical protein
MQLSVKLSGRNSAGGCLLPKSERLSAVGSRVAVPPNRLSYTLPVLAACSRTASTENRGENGQAPELSSRWFESELALPDEPEECVLSYAPFG